MRVVYYGNYLTYFEVGRVEYLRQAGMPIADVNEKVFIPVVEATVRYARPATLDELLEVRCWISERKGASFTFSYEIRNARAQVVATGFTRHACTDTQTGKVVALPGWLRALMPVTAPS